MPNYRLTKSRLLHYRQCPKRLHLEVHRPELAEFDPATERRFDQGHEVGVVAREVYGSGTLVTLNGDVSAAVERTQSLLQSLRAPVYEGTFLHDEVLIRADVILPASAGARVVEVKQSTSVKETYPDDCAIQAWVIEQSGFTFSAFALAHINNQFAYQGDGHYGNLFTEVDMAEPIGALRAEVPRWVHDAKSVVESRRAPEIKVGRHCATPYPCPFTECCHLEEPEFPVKKLPHLGKLAGQLEAEGIADIRDIPDGRLEKPLHERIRRVTISNQVELDPAAAEIVRALSFPRHYLDFETIAFAVPIWKDTRPYQQLPFQWSLHVETEPRTLAHSAFLDISGQLPLRACAEALLDAVGTVGPIIVYTSFEATCLKDLARCLPDLAERIAHVLGRLFDLHKLLHEHYYHRDLKGSWSLKVVLPTIAPELDYANLEEVADGEAAQRAFLSAIDPTTNATRKEELRLAMLRYCAHDTLALVRVAQWVEAAPSAGAG